MLGGWCWGPRWPGDADRMRFTFLKRFHRGKDGVRSDRHIKNSHRRVLAALRGPVHPVDNIHPPFMDAGCTDSGVDVMGCVYRGVGWW